MGSSNMKWKRSPKQDADTQQVDRMRLKVGLAVVAYGVVFLAPIVAAALARYLH